MIRRSVKRVRQEAKAQRSAKNSKVKTRREKYDPMSVDDEVFLQPWFLPKEVYLEIRRLLPNIHLSKMRYYFEDYGCLRCGESGNLYGSNGLCERCSVVIRGRLARCLKRRLRGVGVLGPDNLSSFLNDAMTSAQDLLRGFRSGVSTRR
jgi:hypothetical protein